MRRRLWLLANRRSVYAIAWLMVFVSCSPSMNGAKIFVRTVGEIFYIQGVSPDLFGISCERYGHARKSVV